MQEKDIIDPTAVNRRNAGPRIYKLAPELANQIAAGEVVERPASILKELLENSLDAGSSQIDVRIEKGGLGLIRVQDNGHGICQEDLELALSQHATSKILSFSDLEGVTSFGFRGEALASISAVSRLSLSSCILGQSSGFCIQKSGRNGQLELSQSPPVLGTTVEVRDIFYNTPARRKFLRSEKTESLYLEECFKRIVLSQPEVAFSFKMDAKPIRRWVSCKNLEAERRRLGELCGSLFLKTAYYMEAENNGLKIRGWLGSPTQTRAQADLQYFYVNGRSIRDKVVSYALRQAYQDYAIGGRYPAYVLFFELDPETVDVNVHPTKHEVRFREVRAITAFLMYSLRQALSSLMSETRQALIEKENVNEPRDDLPLQSLIQSQCSSKIMDARYSLGDRSAWVDPGLDQSTAVKPVSGKFIDRVLCLLGNEFLLAENSKGLLLLDIKAIIKAKTQRWLKQGGPAPMQSRPLLMPYKIELKNSIELKKNKTLRKLTNHDSFEYNNLGFSELGFSELGFSWSQIGPNSLLIRQVPFVIKSLSSHFDVFFEKLMALALDLDPKNHKEYTEHKEQAIEYIAEYVAENETLDLCSDIRNIDLNTLNMQSGIRSEKIDGLMQDFEDLLGTSRLGTAPPTPLPRGEIPFYRLLSIEELRWK